MILSEIWIYPVKSLGGIRLKKSQIEQRGLQYDRRWMLVDENGTFLTQRTNPAMALLGMIQHKDGFLMFHKTKIEDSALLPFEPVSGQHINVKIWKDHIQALTVCDSLDAWLSAQLGKIARIVYMPESTHRIMNPDDSPVPALVSFADDFPFLLISQASLDDLNSRLDEPVKMERFRPNFVVSQTAPFAEDHWENIKLGAASFLVSKPCERCVLINVNQDSAIKGTEPLKTLATYRRSDKKIMFGQNLTGPSDGIVNEGDPVSILSKTK